MSFDPDELYLVDATVFLRHVASLLDERKHLLNQILVLDRLLCGVEPTILAPLDVPFSHTLDAVIAVCVYLYRSVAWSYFESALECSQFGTLVGLAGTR